MEWFPDVDRGVLESYVPYATFHHSQMELSLERQKATDELIALTGGKDQAKALSIEEEANPLPPTPTQN